MLKLVIQLTVLCSISCQRDTSESLDFVDQKSFEFNVTFLSAKEANLPHNIIELYAKPHESDESVLLRLDIGSSGRIEQSSSLDSYLLIRTSADGDEYRFYYRDIFDRREELDGSLLPIEQFKHEVK